MDSHGITPTAPTASHDLPATAQGGQMSHAGTREGAKALGLGRGRAYLEKRELPCKC